MLKLTYNIDGEFSNAENLNRPLKEIEDFFGTFPAGTEFLTKNDLASSDNYGNEQLLTYEYYKLLSEESDGETYIGQIRFFPFRPDALPDGWVHANNEQYPTYTDVGKALLSTSEQFKQDWGITKTVNSDFVEVINVPNLSDFNYVFVSDTPGAKSDIKL